MWQCTTNRSGLQNPVCKFSGQAIYKVCSSCVCSRFLRACIGTLPLLNEPLVTCLVTTRVGRYVSIYGQTISRTFFFPRVDGIFVTKSSHAFRIRTHERNTACPVPRFFTISSRGNQKRINKFSTRSRSIVLSRLVSCARYNNVFNVVNRIIET